jgi:hypothetical protein
MANLYSVEQLLVGHNYRSRSCEGEIISAEKSDVYFENAEAYLVRIKTKYSIKDTYRTLAVSN